MLTRFPGRNTCLKTQVLRHPMPVFLKQEKKCYSQKTPASRSLALLHEVVLWAGYLNFLGFPGGSVGIESSCQCRRPGFNPWVGKIPWRRKWQHTPGNCLGNPLDRGTWQATVHGVTKSQRRPSDYTINRFLDFLSLSFPTCRMGAIILSTS